MTNPNQVPRDMMEAMARFWWVDVLIAILVFTAVGVIVATAKKVLPGELTNETVVKRDPRTSLPPRNSDNPYEPPMR